MADFIRSSFFNWYLPKPHFILILDFRASNFNLGKFKQQGCLDICCNCLWLCWNSCCFRSKKAAYFGPKLVWYRNCSRWYWSWVGWWVLVGFENWMSCAMIASCLQRFRLCPYVDLLLGLKWMSMGRKRSLKQIGCYVKAFISGCKLAAFSCHSLRLQDIRSADCCFLVPY